MRSRRYSAMCETALADDPGSLRRPLTQFADGSAAMACAAFDYEGNVWVTNMHFVMIAGPIAALPNGGKMPCPSTFPEILAAVPSTRYAPRIDDDVAHVGPATVERVYLEACSAKYRVEGVDWRASGPRDPVYGLVAGKVVCVLMGMVPKGGAS